MVMTEFEIALLINEYGNSIAVMFGVYMSGIFAMVLASRYLADLQDRFMRGFVIFLFTQFCIVIARGTWTTVQQYFHIRLMVGDRAWETPVLQFQAAISPGDFAGNIAPYVVLSLFVLAYVGAIVYFIRAGRIGSA